MSAMVAERYFAAVRARDIDAFMALFTEDAVFVLPDGGTLTGAGAIREMELETFSGAAPMPSPAAIVAGERGAAVEIDVDLPDGRRVRMADFFHLNGEGLIQKISVYRQG